MTTPTSFKLPGSSLYSIKVVGCYLGGVPPEGGVCVGGPPSNESLALHSNENSIQASPEHVAERFEYDN